MTVRAATCINTVESHPGIKAVFEKCSHGVNRKHRDTLQAATGFLFGIGFLDRSRSYIRGASPQERTRVLDILVDQAVEDLRKEGLLIVPGWWTLAYWVFRWVVLPYLYDLLAEYAQSDVSVRVVVSSATK